MRYRNPAYMAAVAAIVVILSACQATPSRTAAPTGTASPTPAPVGYKGHPVTANRQWTPVIHSFDRVDMALVPAGCFKMGSTDRQIADAVSSMGADSEWVRGLTTDEFPAGVICFDQPFWIDKYEVTNEQFKRLGGQAKQTGHWDADFRPRDTISQKEAEDFCEKRGARLPTEAEWEYAARGPDELLFPWGNDFVADNAIYNQNSGSHSWDVGERPAGASWVGVRDMAGNVGEWTSSAYEPYPYTASHEKGVQDGLFTGAGGVIRGGGWFSDNFKVRGAARDRLDIPELADAVGLRCVRPTQDPAADLAIEPATPSPLAAATPEPTRPVVSSNVNLDLDKLPTGYNGPLPDGAVQQLTAGRLNGSSISPKGAYLALGAGNTVMVYRTETQELLWGSTEIQAVTFAWTLDDARLAGLSEDGLVAWNAATGKKLFKVAGPPGRLAWFSDAAWTPDGRYLVVVDRFGLTQVLDGTTGRRLRSMTYHETPPRAEYPDIADTLMALSPDGKMLATSYVYPETGSCCDPGHTVVIWDVASGAQIHVIDEKESPSVDTLREVYAFAWSPDGRMLAVSALNGDISEGLQLWDTTTWTVTHQVECCAGYRIHLSWSPDGKRLAAYRGEGSEVIDMTSLTSLMTFDMANDADFLGWSADSSQFAYYDWKNDHILFLDAATGEAQIAPSAAGGRSAFTPDFIHFFLINGPPGGYYNNNPYHSLIEWNGKTVRTEKVFTTGLDLDVNGISWSPDGSKLAFGIESQESQLLVWDIKANRAIASINSSIESRFSKWSPDDRFLANVMDNTVDLYDTSTWASPGTYSAGVDYSNAISDLAWSPDSSRFAVLSNGLLEVVQVVGIKTLYQVPAVHEPDSERGIVGWSNNGKQIVTTDKTGVITYWDAETGKVLQTVSVALDAHSYHTLSFSPDLSMVAAANQQQNYFCSGVAVWSTSTGKVLHSFPQVSMLCNPGFRWSPWLPDSSALALDLGRTVALFDPRTGKQLMELPSLPDQFSPDGGLFATLSYPSIVLLWKVP